MFLNYSLGNIFTFYYLNEKNYTPKNVSARYRYRYISTPKILIIILKMKNTISPITILYPT